MRKYSMGSLESGLDCLFTELCVGVDSSQSANRNHHPDVPNKCEHKIGGPGNPILQWPEWTDRGSVGNGDVSKRLIARWTGAPCLATRVVRVLRVCRCTVLAGFALVARATAGILLADNSGIPGLALERDTRLREE
jgi:hypothetical protein